MDAYRLVVTVVVMVAVVAVILLFERRRAERIARDTRDLARGLPPEDDRADGDERRGDG
ncbi:hypothetical protein [Nocardioides xinjiangensis]|uniref:hypothetical protein n=1 Tax=Nocardioides xinjiangensis TaxID=2817376 RepID=UPI001B317A77|nr:MULTISPECIES: hypothetical protein [unclassified Nocardioides]